MTHYTHNLKLCRLFAFGLGFLTLAVSAGGAFGLVWLRKDVANRARATMRVESAIKQAERRGDALESRLAKSLNPQYLASRAPAGLRATESAQIVWMPRAQPLHPSDYLDPGLDQEPEAAPVPVPSPAVVEATPEETPLTISFDLALINRQSAETRAP